MQWVRKCKTVYKKEGGKLVKTGSSSSPAKAKKCLAALYVNSPDAKKK
jgi:hypothetical protein